MYDSGNTIRGYTVPKSIWNMETQLFCRIQAWRVFFFQLIASTQWQEVALLVQLLALQTINQTLIFCNIVVKKDLYTDMSCFKNRVDWFSSTNCI